MFPKGTPGLALDTLARMPLWAAGLNYRHGTGHGVGAGLNVHEGPHSISTRYYNTTPLEVRHKEHLASLTRLRWRDNARSALNQHRHGSGGGC